MTGRGVQLTRISSFDGISFAHPLLLVNPTLSPNEVSAARKDGDVTVEMMNAFPPQWRRTEGLYAEPHNFLF